MNDNADYEREGFPGGWKLVPVEPTPEMVSAAEEAHMPFGDMDIALRMAILSAPSAPAQDVAGLLEWAVDRWHAEVASRPLVNVHRRSLDDTWRQVIRKLGGDAGLLCGPAHDALAAHDKK